MFNIRMDLWEEGFIEPWSLKPEGKRPLGITRPRCVDNIRMDPWGEKFKCLGGKLEGKRPLGRPTSRWVDNIRMGLW